MSSNGNFSTRNHGGLLAPLFLLALAGLSGTAAATEGGGSTYPGTENFLVGAAPPPGKYLMFYGSSYAADKAKDDSGNTVTPPDFKVRVNAAVFRGIWSTPYEVLGGNVVFHAIAPLVDMRVTAGGTSQHKNGLGDVTVGGVVAHHYSPQLHSVFGLDMVLPTGGYNKQDLANIGRNYVTFQPAFALSRIAPGGFNGDFKLTLNLNQKNHDTGYRSGDELFVDYSAGYDVGGGWTIGLGGLLRQQINDDKLDGATLANRRARSFAIGPSIKYDNGRGWFFTAKLEAEQGVRNTTDGSAFWLKTIIPF